MMWQAPTSSPGSPAIDDGEPRGRATSPLRPKARRALMSNAQQAGVAEYEPRRSPMAFQPIVSRSGFEDVEDGETAMLCSMAGLMNAQAWRESSPFLPSCMISVPPAGIATDNISN